MVWLLCLVDAMQLCSKYPCSRCVPSSKVHTCSCQAILTLCWVCTTGGAGVEA